MIRKLLDRLTEGLPMRVIDGDNGQPYLERYFVCRLFGWQAYLHKFVASDPDRGLHDHPWDRAISLVLAGGYAERRRNAAGEEEIERRVRPFTLNLLNGRTQHRVIISPGQTAWSLFAHGPYVKPWGFYRPRPDGTTSFTVAPNTRREWWLTALSRRKRLAGGAQ